MFRRSGSRFADKNIRQAYPARPSAARHLCRDRGRGRAQPGSRPHRSGVRGDRHGPPSDELPRPGERREPAQPRGRDAAGAGRCVDLGCDRRRSDLNRRSQGAFDVTIAPLLQDAGLLPPTAAGPAVRRRPGACRRHRDAGRPSHPLSRSSHADRPWRHCQGLRGRSRARCAADASGDRRPGQCRRRPRRVRAEDAGPFIFATPATRGRRSAQSTS